MAQKTAAPYSVTDLTVPYGEKIAISTNGGEIVTIWYGTQAGASPPGFYVHDRINNEEVLLGTFAAEQIVRIETLGSAALYDIGTSPSVGSGDADTLGGNPPAYYAADSEVVHLSGVETITGVKTFSVSPITNNGIYYKSKETDTTTRSILGITLTDLCFVGTPNLPTNIQSDGTITHNGTAINLLESWEENSDDLRPVVSGTGNLGDSTHLIEGAYFGDSAIVYFGDDQDVSISFDGTYLDIDYFDTRFNALAGSNAEIEICSGDDTHVSQIHFAVGSSRKGKIRYDHDATAANEVLEFNVGGVTNTQFIVTAIGIAGPSGNLSLDSSTIDIDNNQYIRCADTSATYRGILAVNTSDTCLIGNSSLATNIRSNGTLTYNGTTLASGTIDTTAAQTITVVDGLITSIV